MNFFSLPSSLHEFFFSIIFACMNLFLVFPTLPPYADVLHHGWWQPSQTISDPHLVKLAKVKDFPDMHHSRFQSPQHLIQIQRCLTELKKMGSPFSGNF